MFNSAVQEIPRALFILRLVLHHVDFSQSVYVAHKCSLCVPGELKTIRLEFLHQLLCPLNGAK